MHDAKTEEEKMSKLELQITCLQHVVHLMPSVKTNTIWVLNVGLWFIFLFAWFGYGICYYCTLFYGIFHIRITSNRMKRDDAIYYWKSRKTENVIESWKMNVRRLLSCFLFSSSFEQLIRWMVGWPGCLDGSFSFRYLWKCYRFQRVLRIVYPISHNNIVQSRVRRYSLITKIIFINHFDKV